MSYLLHDFPPELHERLKGLYGPHTADMAERLSLSPSPCDKLPSSACT